jgi:stage II sporulation protein AA (anti-sigma F factor antagonist)
MIAYREPVTVVIGGELDHCSAPQIRRQLDDLLMDERVVHVVLDLENLTFMDSSGIGVLLGRLRVLNARGGSLSVKGMRPRWKSCSACRGWIGSSGSWTAERQGERDGEPNGAAL